MVLALRIWARVALRQRSPLPQDANLVGVQILADSYSSRGETYQSSQRITAVTSWLQGAAQREQWKEFSQDWMLRNGCSLSCYYPCRPEEVDLCGRQLLQNGEFFSLLPIRHVPVGAGLRSLFSVPRPRT